jgi:hypothetical protein
MLAAFAPQQFGASRNKHEHQVQSLNELSVILYSSTFSESENG